MPLKRMTPLFLLFFSLACSNAPESESAEKSPEPTPVQQQGQLATGSQGMVSSAHPLATQAGLDVLARGGNAFDAMVAIAATLNVVEPMMSGMGGYGTVLVYDAKTQKSRFLNCSGRIPASLDSDVFRAPTKNYMANRRGPKAISTPGTVTAWELMHKEYGTQPWESLFDVSIKLAEQGFPLGGRTAGVVKSTYETFPESVKAFYGKDGQPLKEGELLVQKDLANSLRLVAKGGAEVICSGELGQRIGATMKAADSFLSLEDLANNKAEWYDPISIMYRDHEVITASPPATAFPSLIRLGLMSQYDAKKLGHNSADYLHTFAEVTKHALWSRLRYAGDPELTPPPLDMLLSEAYWQEQVANIDPAKAKDFVPPPISPAESKNTTHFAVADKFGNVISATQTLGNLFGSRIMAEGTGIWLNNSLAYCTYEPKGNPMDAHAGHHKLSGDCPTFIMKDGRPWVSVGTPGGHTIGQTVPQMVMNLIDFDMDIYQAIASPRVSFGEPNELMVEKTLPESVLDELSKRGHHLKSVGKLGNAHGVTVEYDAAGKPVRFTGASDPRGQGLAKGLK